MIAARQADIIGKMIRGPPIDHHTTWSLPDATTSKPVGCPQTTGKISWWRTSACYSKMLIQSTLIALGHCKIGFTKPPTNNTGISWLPASSILAHHCQNAQKHGDHFHPGAHDKTPAPSNTMTSGGCIRRPKHPFGLPRRLTSLPTLRIGTDSCQQSSISYPTSWHFLWHLTASSTKISAATLPQKSCCPKLNASTASRLPLRK